MTSGSLGLALAFLNFTGVPFEKSVGQLAGFNPGKQASPLSGLGQGLNLDQVLTSDSGGRPPSSDHRNRLHV